MLDKHTMQVYNKNINKKQKAMEDKDMTNMEIITMAALQENIFTQEQVEAFFEAGQMLPLFTYGEWKQRGYQVRKGEKACMKASIWMPRKNKKEQDKEEQKVQKSFYMKTASFFRPEQVDKMN